MLDDFKNSVERKVWKNKNDTRLLVVTGLLEPGKYEIDREVKDDGKIEMTFTPKDDS